jgi:hypothetical protein
VEVHSRAKKQIVDLEAKVKSAEASEKRLQDFKDELVCDLAELHMLYVRNALAIRGLCSPMPEGEPSSADYLRWLSTEISSLLDMFGGVNENFATTAIKGALGW